MSNKLVKKPKKPIYICDPKKNTLCKDRLKNGICGVRCFCTTDSMYAVDKNHMLTYQEYHDEEEKRQDEFYSKR